MNVLTGDISFEQSSLVERLLKAYAERELPMQNSYDYFMENRDECEQDLIALHLMDETLEVEDSIFSNNLPF
jgi:hypothetical protein